MRVRCFPMCCGAGILELNHLTGRGQKEDFKLIRRWIRYARQNGYRMYDFPREYEGSTGDPMSSKAVLDSKTDKNVWDTHNSWGMLLAITAPGQTAIANRLKEFGFKEVFNTHNPVYGGGHHKIHLWALDLNEWTEEMLTEKEEPAKATT